MSRQKLKRWRRIVVVPAGFAIAILVSLTGARALAQDNIANTSGGQGMNALPPPTPPQAGGIATQRVPQPTLSDETRALDASQNTAHSMQKPDQDQSLVPPQTPLPSSAPQPQVYAELGVFTVASEGPGVRVRSVTPGSAAEAAGIVPGDFLLTVEGQSVESPEEVGRLIRQYKPGDSVKLRVWRDRSEREAVAVLNAAQPREGRRVGAYYAPAYDGNVVSGYVPGPIYRRQTNYYPGSYPGGYYGYRNYGYGYPYGGAYYGTPQFGYYNSPWGDGVNIGGFQFGWR